MKHKGFFSDLERFSLVFAFLGACGHSQLYREYWDSGRNASNFSSLSRPWNLQFVNRSMPKSWELFEIDLARGNSENRGGQQQWVQKIFVVCHAKEYDEELYSNERIEKFPVNNTREWRNTLHSFPSTTSSQPLLTQNARTHKEIAFDPI